MTLAVNAIINWCAKNWEVTIIQAKIHNNNEASLFFAHRLGFKAKSQSGEYNIFEFYING